MPRHHPGDGISQAVDHPRADMGECSNTYRLAIGAFYGPQALDAAIIDLFANGLTTREICLVGTRPAFQRIVQQPVGHVFHERSSLLRARPLRPVAVPGDELELLATSGMVQRTLLQEPNWSIAGRSSSGLLGSPGHVDGLADQLRQHAIALLVSAPTPQLQQRSSRILLRHSDHSVQTHEFTSSKAATR